MVKSFLIGFQQSFILANQKFRCIGTLSKILWVAFFQKKLQGPHLVQKIPPPPPPEKNTKKKAHTHKQNCLLSDLSPEINIFWG